jgi:hypothetical protein
MIEDQQDKVNHEIMLRYGDLLHYQLSQINKEIIDKQDDIELEDGKNKIEN